MTQITVQPSEFSAASLNAGSWARGVPTAGSAFSTPPLPSVVGQATCQNLIAGCPPPLRQVYEIYGVTIGWGITLYQSAGITTPPTVIAELALMVNNDDVYVNTDQQTAYTNYSNEYYSVSDVWNADLVNPIRVGARDRLVLRAGIYASAATQDAYIIVGAQYSSPASAPTVAVSYPSTISYNVVELPARRRL